MNQCRANHWTSVIALGTFLAMLQVAGIAVVLILAPQTMPQSDLRFVWDAIIHRNELLLMSTHDDFNQGEVTAVDLQSGRERMIGYPFPAQFWDSVTNDNRLWIFNVDGVVEINGERLTEYQPEQTIYTGFCELFLYEGLPAYINPNPNDGIYRLLVFNQGEWDDRGEVAVPGGGRRWETDEKSGKERLVPLWKDPRSTDHQQWVRVISTGNTQHLFHIDSDSHVVSYRKGLEFVTRDKEIASADIPDNVAGDVTDWKKLNVGFPEYVRFCRASDGVLILTYDKSEKKPFQFWEQAPAGSEKPFRLALEIGPMCKRIMLASTFDGKEVYVIQNRLDFGGPFPKTMLNLIGSIYFIQNRPDFSSDIKLGPRIRRYERGELKEVYWPISTPVTKWIHWAGRILTQVAVVMSVGTILLVCGSMRFSRVQESSYQFGHDTVRLAPIGRRCLARAIDLIFLSSPLIVHAMISWPHVHNEQIFRFYWGSGECRQALEELFHSLTPDGLASILLFIGMILTQSRWGVTPGKWLLGLRTWRTTLRPCGVARSLLRELLMVFDAPLMLTPLPGITSMLATDCRQRLGDLAADTLVIVSTKSSP